MKWCWRSIWVVDSYNRSGRQRVRSGRHIDLPRADSWLAVHFARYVCLIQRNRQLAHFRICVDLNCRRWATYDRVLRPREDLEDVHPDNTAINAVTDGSQRSPPG